MCQVPARATAVVLTLIAVAFAGACSSSQSSKSSSAESTTPATQPISSILWPAPPNPMQLARDAGLVPETAERLQYHVHAHLDVFIDGKHEVVPGGIGINTKDPRVHSGIIVGYPAYGGIVIPCDHPCISPLHTHDATGILHTESATHKDNTLGQFFVEWNVRLDADCVARYCKPATRIAVYVDGQPHSGDPRAITLSNFKEIALIIGTPPAQIPSTADWSQI